MSRTAYKRQSYIVSAGPLGYLEGLTVTASEDPHSRPLCHYFGGIPYALPPIGPYRFRQARPLPEYYRYGTKSNPGRYIGACSVCPQPNANGSTSESLWDEDVLQLNIYIPPGSSPSSGWPVFFYIHGGFLQWGTPNYKPEDMVPLLSESAFQAIVVSPAYRLNAFGFLASAELSDEAQKFAEPVSNFGFWDQRLALEWTYNNITLLGGDAQNITIGGYSAGSHSAYQQLAHELYFVSSEKAIIKRVIMWSNSPGVMPKALPEAQKQFDELLYMLKIPSTLSASDKLQKLRALPAHDLVAVQDSMKISEFRALSDGVFVSKDVMANINSGDFGRRMKARGIKLMNGECRDEHHAYRTWRTPTPTYAAVYERLCADYRRAKVGALMRHYCGKNKDLPPGMRDWQEAFGHLYANMQVHCLERGFHNALVKGGLQPGKDLLRYRFDWRTKGTDLTTPPEMGVTHGTDIAIWFWGLAIGGGLQKEEKKILRPWNEAFASFVKGEHVAWKTEHVRSMMRLTSAGQTDIWTDDRWDEGLELWRAVNPETGVLDWLRSKM